MMNQDGMRNGHSVSFLYFYFDLIFMLVVWCLKASVCRISERLRERVVGLLGSCPLVLLCNSVEHKIEIPDAHGKSSLVLPTFVSLNGYAVKHFSLGRARGIYSTILPWSKSNN